MFAMNELLINFKLEFFGLLSIFGTYFYVSRVWAIPLSLPAFASA